MKHMFSKPILATLFAIAGATYSAQAVVVTTDGGFESNALSGFSGPSANGYQMVLDNEILNVWGSEDATIVTGTTGGVFPFGSKMLSVIRGGTTQTVQISDITSLSGIVDAGTATYDLRAQFTAGTSVSGTTGQLIISFYNASGIDSSNLTLNRIGYSDTALALDALSDWELIQETGTVPVGARFAISELVYLAGGDVGGTFIDQASLSIIPEPSSVTLLGLGAASLLFRRRKH